MIRLHVPEKDNIKESKQDVFKKNNAATHSFMIPVFFSTSEKNRKLRQVNMG